MKNIGQMMQKMQEIQSRMSDMQKKLGEMEIAGGSGGGMVSATLNGKGELRGLKIDPALINPAEKELLEDLIVAAVNDAKAKVDVATQAEAAKLTGGLPLPPGLKLPF